jgi:hypothetical protein
MSNIFTTETLDRAYLEYSNITTAKTAKELKLEQELKLSMHREGALEDILKHNVELINDLKKEVERLKEFEFMYKGLNK